MRKDENNDERFNELVKRMKTFNELLGDYLDAIDMEEGESTEEDSTEEDSTEEDSTEEDK